MRSLKPVRVLCRAVATQAYADGARFVSVSGGDAGRVFRLHEPSPDDGWSLGGDPAADVPLASDPYVARRHARVLARDGGHVLVAGERTIHNWRLLEPGAEAPLALGDLVGVGMTLLVYHPG